LYASAVVCAPRVYMGFHYPTDILAGALIGVGAASLTQIASFRMAVTRPVMRWVDQWPGVFYAGFFLLTFQIAITFDSLRHIGRYVGQLFRALLFGGS